MITIGICFFTASHSSRRHHGRVSTPFVPVVSTSTPTGCLADGQTRQGVLFLESHCAGFPTGARCCNDQHEVAFCHGNVKGGMSVGALQCLPKGS